MVQKYEEKMTYTKKKKRHPCGRPSIPSISAKRRLVSLLFDTGFLTGEVAEVEDAGTTHSTMLVDINLLDERASEGEDALHSDAVSDLADSKGFGSTASTALKEWTVMVSPALNSGNSLRSTKFSTNCINSVFPMTNRIL